jgi:hypothetical protein
MNELRLKDYSGCPLVSCPRLGDFVRLRTGGPTMIVVGVGSDRCDEPSFELPIRVLYSDERGQLHRLTVPYGSLSRA